MNPTADVGRTQGSARYGVQSPVAFLSRVSAGRYSFPEGRMVAKPLLRMLAEQYCQMHELAQEVASGSGRMGGPSGEYDPHTVDAEFRLIAQEHGYTLGEVQEEADQLHHECDAAERTEEPPAGWEDNPSGWSRLY